MAWGELLSTLASATGNDGIAAGISFFSNLNKSREADKESKTAKNEYYAALARQKQLAELAASTAAQRAQFESILKSNIMSQTGTMGATLRKAQSEMGAMPQYNQGRINADYQATKSTMMNDFNDMLRLVESQGRSSDIDRLGGAGSTAVADTRLNSLVKRFQPELQKIDDAAYDSALNRATTQNNLINQNRQNTLNEIGSLYEPELKYNGALLQNNGDMSTPNDLNTKYGQTQAATSRSADVTSGNASASMSDALRVALGDLFKWDDTVKGNGRI